MPGDQHIRHGPHERSRFGQHQFDQPRVRAGDLGEPGRFRTGRDGFQVDEAVLSLGDDLLGDDQHVVRPRVELGERIAQDRDEIVSGADLADEARG